MWLENNLSLNAHDIIKSDLEKENLSWKDATTITNSDSDSNYRCDKILFFTCVLSIFQLRYS